MIHGAEATLSYNVTSYICLSFLSTFYHSPQWLCKIHHVFFLRISFLCCSRLVHKNHIFRYTITRIHLLPTNSFTSKTIITNSSDSSTEAPGLKTSTLWRWKNRLNSNAKYKYYKNFSKTKFVTKTGACIRRGIVLYPRSGWLDALLDTLLGMAAPSVCV